MKCPARPFARDVCLAAALALGACPAHAFLGVGDVSFVTVIANPAEAANWAAELDQLNSQLTAAQGTLQTVGDLRTFAGDPKAAVAGVGDLGAVTGAVGNLVGGAATGSDLALAWQSLSSADQLAQAAALLQAAGPGTSMTVFGQQQARDASSYEGLAASAASSQQVRGQIAAEQAARAVIAATLTQAWGQFRQATTESSKQALLTQISQLQSQDQLMASRRRAILDDLDLADRQDRNAAAVRSRAADEEGLAASSVLAADFKTREQGAEAQRLATLQKTPPAPQPADYSGVRLWTTADAGGLSQ
jgi:hypothetical protein